MPEPSRKLEDYAGSSRGSNHDAFPPGGHDILESGSSPRVYEAATPGAKPISRSTVIPLSHFDISAGIG